MIAARSVSLKVLTKARINGISNIEQQSVDHKSGLIEVGQVKLVELVKYLLIRIKKESS